MELRIRVTIGLACGDAWWTQPTLKDEIQLYGDLIDLFGLTNETIRNKNGVIFKSSDPTLAIQINDWLASRYSRYSIHAMGACSLDVLVNAAYVPLHIDSDFVDLDKNELSLNRYEMACSRCGWADFDHIPSPVKVSSRKTSKNRDIHYGMNGMIYVTERGLRRFESIFGDEIMSGRAEDIVRNSRNQSFYWIRPIRETGLDARMVIEENCTLCARPTKIRYRGKLQQQIVETFGGHGAKIARVKAWRCEGSNANDQSMRALAGVTDIVVMGRLLLDLLSGDPGGICVPSTGPYFSKEVGEQNTSKRIEWRGRIHSKLEPEPWPAMFDVFDK